MVTIDEQQVHGGLVTLTIDDRLVLSSFEQDVLTVGKENSWATIYGLEALSTVISKNILSICPKIMRSGLRNTYHKVIEPAMGSSSDDVSGSPVCILWVILTSASYFIQIIFCQSLTLK